MNKNSMNHISDNFELQEEYNFSKGIRGRFYNPQKKSTTIRLKRVYS